MSVKRWVMFKKIILPALLVAGMSASAAENTASETKGLVGIELGYINTNYTAPEPNPGDDDTDNVGAMSIGLKLGAEGEFYRVFVVGNYWNTSEYDHAGTLGGALQYLMHPSDTIAIFIGLNGGWINTIDTNWDPYYGADAGLIFDVSEKIDIELGARACTVDSDDTPYYARDFVQGYASVIFKFTGAY